MTLSPISLRMAFALLLVLQAFPIRAIQNPYLRQTYQNLTPEPQRAGRLEPYDAFLIRCPSHPSLQATVTLNPIGVGELLFGKRLVFAGLRLEEARAKIQSLFENQLGVGLPDLSVKLTVNPKAPIRYSGELKKTGTVFPSKGLKLSDVLAIGQPGELSDLNAVEIRSGEEVIRIDLRKADPELRAGDKVFIPRLGRIRQIFVLGAVKKPGAFGFMEGLTAKRAVELAGGASAPGDLSQVRVDREGKSLGILDFSFGDSPLEPGDTVTVAFRQNAPVVLVFGGAVRPGRVYFEPGLTLQKAVEEAGGAKARRGKVNVVSIENGHRSTKSYDLEALLNGKLPDIPLKANDRIELPEVWP